jgi:hypothetical protein
MEWAEQQDILRELNSDYCKYKLLYVTPEKVARWVSLLIAASSLKHFFLCIYSFSLKNHIFHFITLLFCILTAEVTFFYDTWRVYMFVSCFQGL